MRRNLPIYAIPHPKMILILILILIDFDFDFFNSQADGVGKLKLMLTTLPRIFIHVCPFNSIAFAIQLVFWRVLQFPR